MKSCLLLARRVGPRGLVPRFLVKGTNNNLRSLAGMTSPPSPTQPNNPPPAPFPYAVDAPDGTCEQVDAAEEQRVVNDFVEVEADHAFTRHLEEDHVDFFGPATGPLQATHPPVLSRNKRQDEVSPQHLLAVTPEDVARMEKEQFLKVAVCLEDLHFTPHEDEHKNDPAHFRAVDAPDGTTDDTVQKDLDEVEHWITDAAEHEDKEFVEKLHAEQADAARIFAVETPDGTPDEAVKQDLAEVEHWIKEAAEHEDKEFVQRLHAQQEQAARVFAVDSPDGTPDDAIEEDMHCIEEIIDYAAEHEDEEEILRVHKENEEIKETLSQNFPKGPFNLP